MTETIKERVVFFALGIPMVMCLIVFFWILAVLSSGAGTLNLNMLTTSVLQGGLFEMIVGTIYLLLGAAGVAGPIGIFAAVYLVEYAPSGKVTRIIDQAINNLAGVPSIVIGLFGFSFFTTQLGFGRSLLAGWLTLSLMMLPIVIRGTEEALKLVPPSFQEASLALGTTKWRAITATTIPSAAPGIVTSVILGIARVAGETAAILFTSCVLTTRGLPKSIFEPVMALAYNLYVQIVAIGAPAESVFGGALVLFLIVAVFAVIAIVIRTYYRRRQPWLR